MKPFLSIIALLLICVTTAHAADIWVKKEDPTKEEAAPQQDQELLELLDEAPAPAEKPAPEPQSINDFANVYYKNCLAQDHPTLKEDQLTMLCACTAANIPGTMTVQNMRDMQTNTAEGQTQRARMLMFVYTPCIEFPTKALVMQQCLSDPKVKSGMKHYYKVCDCLSDGMAKFMKERAPKTVETALNRNKTDLDPLRLLLESPAFEEESKYHMTTCVQTHEFGMAQ